MKHKLWLLLPLLLLIGYRGNTPALTLYNSHPDIVKQTPITPPLVPDVPLPIASSTAAISYIVVDTESGTVIGGKNIYAPRSPASTVKLAGAIVARKTHNTDKEYTVKRQINEEVSLQLQKGQKLTLHNLLYASLVASANDAAQVIADNYPGGEAAFVQQMNKLAGKLDMRNSHFVNAIGFDNPQQFTTAYDLSLLALHALKDPLLKQIISTPSITIPDASFRQFFPLYSSNQLLGTTPGVGGMKTGKTEEAGENLISLYRSGKRSYIIVVLGSQQRFEDTQAIIDSLSYITYVPFPVYSGLTAGK